MTLNANYSYFPPSLQKKLPKTKKTVSNSSATPTVKSKKITEAFTAVKPVVTTSLEPIIIVDNSNDGEEQGKIENNVSDLNEEVCIKQSIVEEVHKDEILTHSNFQRTDVNESQQPPLPQTPISAPAAVTSSLNVTSPLAASSFATGPPSVKSGKPKKRVTPTVISPLPASSSSSSVIPSTPTNESPQKTGEEVSTFSTPSNEEKVART